MTHQTETHEHALKWTGQSLLVLDQRKLPDSLEYIEYSNANGVVEAISSMQVRGAPAIGIAAAYGVVLSVMEHFSEESMEWQNNVAKDMDKLGRSRPTAVNLFWALNRMRDQLKLYQLDPIRNLLQEAKNIHAEDVAANKKMGELGAECIGQVQAVITHCNAGALATGGYGTALGVVRSLAKKGLQKVYACETRPWLQGARLTAWELQQDGIPVTLIADSAAALLMQRKLVSWVIVGADRVASNGDFANKIGTYSLALIARQHGVKFMVVAPTSTIDWAIQRGEDIEIEERSQEEIIPPAYQQSNNSIVNAWNPVFDVTPHEYINALVTEKGVVLNPKVSNLRSIKDS